MSRIGVKQKCALITKKLIYCYTLQKKKGRKEKNRKKRIKHQEKGRRGVALGSSLMANKSTLPRKTST
jgi:hypothetical protein